MRYMGGKQRISKPLCEYLNSQLKDNQPFIDMFCGSANVITKIDRNRKLFANDLHYPVIAMWKAIQDGTFNPWKPTEDEYKEARNDVNNEKYPAWYRGFIGHGCSFSGKWWGGFTKDTSTRDYYLNALSSVAKKSSIKDVVLSSYHYEEFIFAGEHSGAVIYCDIPYKDTTSYSAVEEFNHDKFYKWATQIVNEGYVVLVSEYEHNVPEGWEIVWRLESKKDMRNKDGVQEETVEILMKPVV